MASSAPIGVFDSGLGGLTVVRQLHLDLPHERILYYGDSAHAPYGVKPPEQVRGRCFAIADRFMSRHVKAIVVACNTATSVCVNDLRLRYGVPVIGMEPAVKLACERGGGRPQRVIVAATPLTLREHKFAALMDRFKMTHTILSQPCPDLVEIVEAGQLGDQRAVDDALHRYFGHYDYAGINSVVLGCTHFVFYRPELRRLLPSRVALIDGNAGTVRHVKDVLSAHGELAAPEAGGSVELSNSDTSERMTALSRRLLEHRGA